MAEGQGAAWKRAIVAVHTAAAALPLMCLGAYLSNVSATGFEAKPELYPRIENEAESIAPYLIKAWQNPRGRIAVVCGMTNATPSADGEPVQLLAALAEAGVRLRVVSEHANLDEFLPQGAQRFAALEEAAVGAHALIILDEQRRFADIDFARVSESMVGKLVFDLTGGADGVAADQAGLQLVSQGAPLGPPWLDPDLRAYADHLRQKVPRDDGILLVMASPPGTLSGRARWFLHLNNLIFPRRVYLQDSYGASGTSVQFRQWTLDMRADFPGRGTQRWEPEPRELSSVTRVGPVRTLNDAERAAIREHDVQWVTFFTMTPDFRLQDWETMTVEAALAGPPKR